MLYKRPLYITAGYIFVGIGSLATLAAVYLMPVEMATKLGMAETATSTSVALAALGVMALFLGFTGRKL